MDQDVFCAVALPGVALGQGQEEWNKAFLVWEDANAFSGY